MGDAQNDRLVQQLRNAERRLAAAEKAQLNVSASAHDGYGGSRLRDQQLARGLNRRINEANDIEGLRGEVARLRAAVGPKPRGRGLRAWLRRALG